MSTSFFSELKRRNVFKVTGGYLLLGWLVLQIADVVIPALNLPAWTMSFLLMVGLFGLPFVIFFSWVYELTPEGLKLTKDVDTQESMTRVTGKKLEYMIIAGLSLALLLVVIKPNFIPNIFSNDEPEVTTTAIEEPETAEQSIPSIAVLPFADFSPNKDQEYFSNGISEEILNLLAKTNRLQVAARTSSFAFRGDNSDIKEIGRKLEVDTVLEGSIRKSNNKIRITAQLINVADGYHIWSETFDRELEDIFAVQDEISQSILNSLKIHLLGDSSNGTDSKINLDAYDNFLIANERLQRNSKEDLQSAITLFNAAIKIQPDYDEAKIKLVLASMLLEYKGSDYDESEAQQKVTDSYIAQYLQPLQGKLNDNYQFNGVLGRYHQLRFRSEVAKEYLEKAIELNSNYADAYLWRANLHYEKADYKAMLADRETAYKLNPMSLEISRELARDYRNFWQPDDANKIIDRMFVLHPGHPDAFDAKVSNLTAMGKYAEAILILEEALTIHPDNQRFKNWLVWGYAYLNKQDKVAEVDVDWANYELTMRQANVEKALAMLETGLASEEREDWLFEAGLMYMLINDAEKLKSTIVESIASLDTRNVPWQKRCFTYMIAAMQMVDMNDNIKTMMDNCRETTEKRLEAGYLCPCSWYRLIEFAILDNRHEDAVKRAEEWLDHGDSHHRLKTDPLFIRLEKHQKYDTLLKRNDAQLERQIRIYDNGTELRKPDATAD